VGFCATATQEYSSSDQDRADHKPLQRRPAHSAQSVTGFDLAGEEREREEYRTKGNENGSYTHQTHGYT
jgi:hypothetical protein